MGCDFYFSTGTGLGGISRRLSRWSRGSAWVTELNCHPLPAVGVFRSEGVALIATLMGCVPFVLLVQQFCLEVWTMMIFKTEKRSCFVVSGFLAVFLVPVSHHSGGMLFRFSCNPFLGNWMAVLWVRGVPPCSIWTCNMKSITTRL